MAHALLLLKVIKHWLDTPYREEVAGIKPPLLFFFLSPIWDLAPRDQTIHIYTSVSRGLCTLRFPAPQALLEQSVNCVYIALIISGRKYACAPKSFNYR